MNNSEGLQSLQNSLSSLPQWVSERILHQVSQLTNYVPVIGIMGKTGVGKSSLCNALFADSPRNRDVISNVVKLVDQPSKHR